MTCDHPSRLLALYLIICATSRASYFAQGARDFEKKVSMLLEQEPENPKCFAQGRKDFTCFWAEDEERAGSVDQYAFMYTYQNENSSRCPLRALRVPGGKRLFVCHLNQTQMFVQMDIQINREGKPIYNRSLLIELTFLLDPPANVTVSRTGHQGQLNVTWVPPPLKYMDDSMMYEVSYTAEDSQVGQVEVVWASSESILRGLQPGMKYKVRVRVKLDGISYSGYWSAWSDPVFVETLPAELDPLIVSLIVIISVILLIVSIMMLLSYRRFLMNKIWPAIPTPDSKFQGLFTVYDGNFQLPWGRLTEAWLPTSANGPSDHHQTFTHSYTSEWLGHTNGNLWLRPTYFYSEECPSPLEVLSELCLSPSLPSPPLPPKASRALSLGRKDDTKTGLEVREPLERGDSTQSDNWLMDRLRAMHQHPIPCSQSSLLESQDTYITLSKNNHSEDEHPNDPLEETLPLEVLFTSRKTILSESHSDLGSGSGHLSSQSSFEYPNHAGTSKCPGYTYMAVADSGVSMDYSPMSRLDDIGRVALYAHDYKNEIPVYRGPFLQRQYSLHGDC